MNSRNRFIFAAFIAIIFSKEAVATPLPKVFSACLKQTEHDRMTCQSGCGMILQQCYDEADDALTKDIDAQLSKPRSASCNAILKKYIDGSTQQTASVAADADAQPGWLGAELKMKLLQQQSETVKLISDMCK
jgi:hypothetical protein